MKKTTFVLILALWANFSFAQQFAEYLAGLNGPTKMTVDGTTIYVNGYEDIYTVNTTAANPSATLIYSLPANFYAYKTEKLGNNLFILVENYIESTNTFIGTQIVKLDVNNLAAGTQAVVTSSNFISSIALSGNTPYYSEEIETAPDVFTINILSFDATLASPTPMQNYANLNVDVVDDMKVYNNDLYLSCGHVEKIFKINLMSSASVPVEYLNTSILNFNKGIFISSAGELYITNAHQLAKIDLNTPGASLQLIGQNTTYQDNEGSGPFYANFRDVVLIGNKAYLTLENQGRIVTLIDTFLETPDFSKNRAVVYPNPVMSTVTIANNADFSQFELYDLAGKKIKEGTVENDALDFSAVSTGIYLLQLQGNGKKQTIKLAKQ
mgnify:CR=1 FL=1